MKTFTVHVYYCDISSSYNIQAASGAEAVRMVRESFGPEHNPFVVLGF